RHEGGAQMSNPAAAMLRQLKGSRRRVVTALVAVVMLLVVDPRGVRSDPLSRDLDDYVLLARRSIGIKNYSFGIPGNAGLHEGGATMRWGKRSFSPDHSQIVSDTIKQAGNGSSVWDIYSNRFNPLDIQHITVRDQGPSPFTPPIIDPLTCAAPPCAAGT